MSCPNSHQIQEEKRDGDLHPQPLLVQAAFGLLGPFFWLSEPRFGVWLEAVRVSIGFTQANQTRRFNNLLLSHGL